MSRDKAFLAINHVHEELAMLGGAHLEVRLRTVELDAGGKPRIKKFSIS
jgi:hypothetical protein